MRQSTKFTPTKNSLKKFFFNSENALKHQIHVNDTENVPKIFFENLKKNLKNLNAPGHQINVNGTEIASTKKFWKKNNFLIFSKIRWSTKFTSIKPKLRQQKILKNYLITNRW